MPLIDDDAGSLRNLALVYPEKRRFPIAEFPEQHCLCKYADENLYYGNKESSKFLVCSSFHNCSLPSFNEPFGKVLQLLSHYFVVLDPSINFTFSQFLLSFPSNPVKRCPFLFSDCSKTRSQLVTCLKSCCSISCVL
jgi:hypothetical protein